jgi:hypothetical protein
MAEGGVKGIVSQIRLIETFVNLELLIFVLGCQVSGVIQREEDTTRELGCKLLSRKLLWELTYTTGGRPCGMLTPVGGVARCCRSCAGAG